MAQHPAGQAGSSGRWRVSVIPERRPSNEPAVPSPADLAGDPVLTPVQESALRELASVIRGSKWLAAYPKRTFAHTLKRLMDVAIALPAVVIGLPFVAIGAGLVLILDRHAPFYADVRIGRGGKPFRCLKIRSMQADPRILDDYLAAHPNEWDEYRLARKLRFDPRITRVGALLRHSSIDEFPQIWNVLKGDMSLVGPRPLAPSEYLARGEECFPLALVRPGLTGLWQTRGRSDLTLKRRIRLDNFYAEHWSLSMDLGVLLRTPFAVIRGKGAR